MPQKSQANDPFYEERQRMVDEHVLGADITNQAVIAAMRTVPRHLFIPKSAWDRAYQNAPQNIPEDQTISQPYIVALMLSTAQIKPEFRVLEIGTGSGYGAAVASLCAKEVYSVERIPRLAKSAIERFEKLSYANIHVKLGLEGARTLRCHYRYLCRTRHSQNIY